MFAVVMATGDVLANLWKAIAEEDLTHLEQLKDLWAFFLTPDSADYDRCVHYLLVGVTRRPTGGLM